MEELIIKHIGLINRGFDEKSAWHKLLGQSQLERLKAYGNKDYNLVKAIGSDIDFIQKQIINLKEK
jgi:hypothetical protein